MSDQVVHISDITVIVIVHLDIIVDIVVHLDIVATESCDDEVVVSTWFPRNAVAKLPGVVVIILPMVVMKKDCEVCVNHLPLIATNLIPRNAVCVSA